MDRRTFLHAALVGGLGYAAGVGAYFTFGPGSQGTSASDSSKTKSFGHQWLGIEEEVGAGPKHFTMLDQLVDEAATAFEQAKKSDLRGKPGESTYDYLLQSAFFQAVGQTLKNNHFTRPRTSPFLLYEALESKLLQCVTGSAICLAVAERTQVPVYGVLTPSHMFVRWDSDGKHNSLKEDDPVNAGDRNYEAQEQMGGVPDSHYLQSTGTFGAPIIVPHLHKTDCMRNLSLDESLSMAHYNAALELEHKYDKSHDSHYLNLALRHLSHAIRLVPNYYKFYSVRSDVYKALGDSKEAQSDEIRSDELLVRRENAPTSLELPRAV